MWYEVKNELLDNRFSLLLAAFAVAGLLTAHSVWGNWLDGGQVRTVIFLMCVTAGLLTLHVNRIYGGGVRAAAWRGVIARQGVVALFWTGALGGFCVMSRLAGTMSAATMWGLLSASGLLLGLNSIFAMSSAASGDDSGSMQHCVIASFFEVLLVGATLFWAVLLSGYFDSATPLRSLLLYIFFTPIGALAHLLLGSVLCATSLLVFSPGRSGVALS